MASGLRSVFDRKYVAILQALCHLTNEQRIAILRKADPKLVRCICECALNVLHGNVHLKNTHKKQLKRYAKVLRYLANKNDSLKNKKRLIVQRGGFLPLLLAPVLGTVLSRLIGEN